MKRRNLLKLAGLAGLAALAPAAIRPARAGLTSWGGPFLITVQAAWGWDPTLFCDPKGAPINDGYPKAGITTSGNIQFAPYAYNQQLFTKHAGRLCVFNGVELAAHHAASGNRHVWTGTPEPGYPALPALAAAALGESLPMAFVSTGGFEQTAGVVSRSCIRGTTADDWRSLVDGGPDGDPLFSQATEDRIAQYRRERIAARKKTAAHLPALARALDAAERAEMSRLEVERWVEAFPAAFAEDETRSLIQLILAAFRAGVAVSANLSWSVAAGQFDAWQVSNFEDWTAKFDALLTEIDDAGMTNQVIVVAGSSSGRTPMYLEDKMKGQWSVTSMLAAGPGIPGNRVIGATDDDLLPVAIDPKTLTPDPAGVRLRPAHIHRALRKILGVAGSPLDERFPLPGEDLPLFES
jgi:hypothetical protein